MWKREGNGRGKEGCVNTVQWRDVGLGICFGRWRIRCLVHSFAESFTMQMKPDFPLASRFVLGIELTTHGIGFPNLP